MGTPRGVVETASDYRANVRIRWPDIPRPKCPEVNLVAGTPHRHPRLDRVTVRVRFAPSPTGMFHVGGARSALQNWIYAKQHDGVFVLRIEDTDASRNKPEWTEGILAALDWIGIARGTYEGPYFQSSYACEHG